MGLDSVELIIDVEKHFSITIPDGEAEKAYTVGNLVDCVANILAIKSYDFTLRENTFTLFKNEIQKSREDSGNFSINSIVTDNLDIKDKSLIQTIESNLNLKLPGIYFKPEKSNKLLSDVKRWLTMLDNIDLSKITWKKFIDITLATNLNRDGFSIKYNSKYEIYIAIMRITVDKVGVNYNEIGIEKSFTDDLGID